MLRLPRPAALALTAALAGHCGSAFAAGPVFEPETTEPDALAASAPQRLAPMLERYQADLTSVEHVHDIPNGQAREAALRQFHGQWLQRVQALKREGMGLEDRIDRLLFERMLNERMRQLDFESRRYLDTVPLLPGIDALIALLEERRTLEYPDGQASAAVLDRARAALSERMQAIGKDGARAAPGIRPVVANRAAGVLDRSREALKQWHAFYSGFDPELSWWIDAPYRALDEVMSGYAKLLREKLAGADDPETIVGDPVGREAIVADLAYEMIPYTPEELLQIAERELAWTHEQMRQAAGEMGFTDWRKALEQVKSEHVAPGEQPRLVAELAREAVEFLRRNDLVTVPELAAADWRMNMLDPKAQLQAPFFLGGEDVWVAFPDAQMPFEKKRMALRGNNRHFSRAVVHHELIPGHHLQHFMAQRYQPQRRLFATAFWTEGWALYWELLLWDKGFATTPQDKLGMLFWRAHRAARIQFSLGFHLGTMSPQQAIDLLVENGHERENAAAEVRRSFAGDYPPIYQSAYLLGGLQFHALHRELVDGGRMSERAFHDAILQGGPMPVEMVRARLLKQAPADGFRPSWRFYALPPIAPADSTTTTEPD